MTLFASRLAPNPSALPTALEGPLETPNPIALLVQKSPAARDGEKDGTCRISCLLHLASPRVLFVPSLGLNFISAACPLDVISAKIHHSEPRFPHP